MMNQLNTLLYTKRVRQTVYGLSRSHLNSVKLFSIDKGFSIRPDNISMVYEAAISYYNAGFAKETGEIKQPKGIIEDYLNLITLMFSEAFGHEKTVVSVKDINVQDALLDYSLFSLYMLLINYKNIRTAVWEDFSTAEFAITSLYDVIHNTSKEELSQSDRTRPQLPIDKWKKVASNIVWNIKQFYELLDK